MRLHIENLQQQVEDFERKKSQDDDKDLTSSRLEAELREMKASNDEIVDELKRRLQDTEEVDELKGENKRL